ncbi:MAG: type II toxin-antitoxin system VapC family toxin [Gaiellaceae bacterium]
MYADASALVKLAVVEAETEMVRQLVEANEVATTRVALVEVAAAVGRSRPDVDAGAHALSVIETMVLVDPTPRLLTHAAALARPPLRALDAIHLASALAVEAEAMLVYDRRLSEAARSAGLAVLSPA